MPRDKLLQNSNAENTDHAVLAARDGLMVSGQACAGRGLPPSHRTVQVWPPVLTQGCGLKGQRPRGGTAEAQAVAHAPNAPQASL